MARTGLRMMPTFPSPPLKFRTASFPRYGLKASLSGRAFPNASAVKPAPGMPASVARFASTLRTLPLRTRCPRSVSRPAVPPRAAVREAAPASLPQGSLAPVRVMLSRSIVAYYDPIRQSRGHAATSRPSRLYAAPSLCGSASATHETFPTFTAVLSTRAVDPTPVGPRRPSRCARRRDTRLPRHISESPPTITVSASNARRSGVFGAASFASCCGPCVCLALQAGYDRGQPYALPHAFRGHRHPRFWRRPSPAGAGGQARGANGKYPLVGTFTQPVHGS